MDAADRSKEGQIQLSVEYGSQHGQLQVCILEVNSLILPAVKHLGISHVYVKSHLLSEKTKDILRTKASVKGFFISDASKETKRKTEEVKLTLSCQDKAASCEETSKNNEKSRKNRLRKALQKQRDRFRLRRDSDKVKTVVNAAGEDNGRATLSFERALYYPSVSLYQLQTQSLHLTICGRNVFTTQTYPIATMCIPLMIAIKQHHPTWYPLSYNPDLITSRSQQTSVNLEQESWEKLEGGIYTGRSFAWNAHEKKETNQDKWLHKRKDYSRHLPQKPRKQPVHNSVASKKNSLETNKSMKSVQERLPKKREAQQEHKPRHVRKTTENQQANCMNQTDSGADLDKFSMRQDSIEELHFSSVNDTPPKKEQGKIHQHAPYRGSFRKPQKQWTSEFLLCAPPMDSKQTNSGDDMKLSSLSLNRNAFGERIRSF